MDTDKQANTTKGQIKFYAWLGSLSLVCLFIGIYMGIMILAMKATEVFEGIAPLPTKLIWSQVLCVVFIGISIALGAIVLRGLRNIK